jgi:hypothetical protein
MIGEDTHVRRDVYNDDADGDNNVENDNLIFDCDDADASDAKVEYELYLVRARRKMSKEADTSGGSASARSC